MRHLFWERLAVALEWVDGRLPTSSSILDFGCGMGLLFPALQRRGFTVLACDLHSEVPAASVELLGIRGVRVLDASEGLAVIADGSVDAIRALDLLEHVAEVKLLGREFGQLLNRESRVLCGLPTEKWLYRIGRRLAGFSGHCHVHDPRHVVTQLASHLRVRRKWRLYPSTPFFDFFEAHR